MVLKKPTYEMLEDKIKALESSAKMIDILKDEIKLNNSFLEMLFDAIPSPIFYKDRDGKYINCNDAFSNDILGIKKEDIIGKTLYEFPNTIPKKNADIYYEKDNELLQNHKTQFYNTEVKCSDNITRYYSFYKAVFKSETGEALGIIGIMMDITEMQQQEKELVYLSSIDPMTKLYNRRYLVEASNHILDLARRNKLDTSVVMIDIDNFKFINDNYSHKIGDTVIMAFADKLQILTRKSDIISRWGGEEFLIVLPETSTDSAMTISEKIRLEVEHIVLELDDSVKLSFTISMGVSTVDNLNDENIELAIHRADKALYEAKNNGKNKVCKN